MFEHDQGRGRQDHVRDVAEIWAEAAAVAESVAEPRPLEVAKNSTTTVFEVAESGGEGEAGSSGSRARDTASAGVTAVAKPTGQARPSGFAKHSASSVPTIQQS